MKCTVGTCERPIKNKALGLCDPHYKRHWRTGDTQAHIPLAPERRKPLPVTDHDDGTRTCPDCGQRKALHDFHADKNGPRGRRTTCAQCRAGAEMQRYNADPEAQRQRMRQHRRDNLQQVREREARAYEKHREARIESAIEHSHIRRARIQDNGYERGVTVTSLRKRYGDQCHYCGITMTFERYARGHRPGHLATLEHLTPISRGGSHTFDNCTLACWACNISKSAGEYPKRLMPAG